MVWIVDFSESRSSLPSRRNPMCGCILVIIAPAVGMLFFINYRTLHQFSLCDLGLDYSWMIWIIMLSWNNTTGINNDACTNYSLHEINFDFKQPNLSQAIPVGIILGLFTVLTVGGNLLVLLSVGTDRHLRSQRHTVLIANLAIFDLTLGSIVFPFSATLEILDDQWLFGRTFCSIWAAIDVLCCTGSIWSLGNQTSLFTLFRIFMGATLFPVLSRF